MSDCTRIEPLLSARLDGLLTAEETVAVEAHLAQCSACRALYDDLVRIDCALSGMSVDAPDTVLPRVLRTIAPRRPAVHWRRWGGMAAALAVVLIGAWSMRTWLPAAPQVPPPPMARHALPEGAGEGDVETYRITSDEAPTAGGDEMQTVTTYAGEADAAESAVTVIDPATAGGGFTSQITPKTSENEPVILTEPAPEPEPAAQDAEPGEALAPAPEPEPAPASNEVTVRYQAADDGDMAAWDEIAEAPATGGGGGGVGGGAGGGAAAIPDDDTMIYAFSAPAPAAPPESTLTPAEAEGILRAYLGGGTYELSYGGVIAGGAYHRFDRADTGETYAVSLDGEQIVQQGTPESELIADWDPE